MTNEKLIAAIAESPFDNIVLPKDVLLKLIEDRFDIRNSDLEGLHQVCGDAVRKHETEFYDVDSADFELDHNNQVQLSTVDINVDDLVERVLDCVVDHFTKI